MKYADVIVDISHDSVDRPFEYIIPEDLEEQVQCGSQVTVPFGRGSRKIQGFVINVKDCASFDESKLKSIHSVTPKSTSLEGHMIELAAFIRHNYGSTMNRALKIVLPVKRRSAPIVQKMVCCCADEETLAGALEKYTKDKRTAAKSRLLKEIISEKALPYDLVRHKLNIAPSTLGSLEKEGLIRIDAKENLRDVLPRGEKGTYEIRLNPQQQEVTDLIWQRYEDGDRRPSLIRGITGSGKTEIYIELISRMVQQGRQAIVLIPEIALTYQTVLRFYKKFGDRISVVNSRLTMAQKYDQLEKVRRGDVDIIIGPRSALFAPFSNLGIVIIDEEHEGTYKNEHAPGYHSREVAIKLASMTDGIVVMGSATPSVESYFKAKKGIYALYQLDQRAKGSVLPQVEIVDLRKELQAGNRHMISRRLYELIRDRLEKKEQIMLFINRRAYQSFVSCRSCGIALKCPHCDVSLKYHKNGKLICHYCGYEMPMIHQCPSCGSPYIGTYGAGTQKVEEEVSRLFPDAAILRMDMDTTKEKDGHEKILSAFSDHEADILVGTQMIVKGHDFPNVTLVGILAADLSLYAGHYLAQERTFQLLTQAAGRAGRGSRPGNVVIQTYSPDNYSIVLGAKQDYPGFFEHEMAYRKLLGYPPAMNMVGIMISSEKEAWLDRVSQELSFLIDQAIAPPGPPATPPGPLTAAPGPPAMPPGTAATQPGPPVPLIQKIGPSQAPISKIKDSYRKMIYIKAADYEDLTRIKDLVEAYAENWNEKDVRISFDFSLKN